MYNGFDGEIMLKKMLDFCDGIDISEFSDMLFVHESPEISNVHYMPRLSLLIEGSAGFKLYERGRMKKCEVHAPYINYCTRSGYLWGTVTPGEVHEYKAVSFCYLPNYIRVTWGFLPTGDASDPKPDRNGICHHYYHSAIPLSEGGTALLNAFEKLQLQGEKELALRLVRELWNLTLRELAAARPAPTARFPRSWTELNFWLRNHRSEGISREKAARMFQLSPGYLSRLTRRYAGCDFVTLVTRYKLEHAAILLRESHFSIDEISEQSGFKYRSYFDRKFKQFYGITPRAYRDKTEE